jgi:hypothetical protein
VRSKKNRDKCRSEKEWDRRHRKFYGFVYRLHNKDLKDNEKLHLKDCPYLDWLEQCYKPLVYISKDEIERHYKKSFEKNHYSKPCIEVSVEDPFSSPYGDIRNGIWLLTKPGYYRVQAMPRRNLWGETLPGNTYETPHYNGMPYFNYHNDRCHNNYVSRAYHEVLKHYRDIRKQILKDKQVVEMRKVETYNRLKYKQMLKRDLERMDSRKRSKRVSGVMITGQTKSFFQALAMGSALKEKVA